jgi:hypothetical protein
MKKKLNIDQVQSELRGGSAFFPGYNRGDSPLPPPQKQPKKDSPEAIAHKDSKLSVKATNLKGAPQGVPPPVRGTVPPPLPLIPKVRRPIKQRQPFDIFQDQYDSLKSIADAEKGFENGRSMNKMVRDAIDNYLRDHPERKK